MLSTSIRAARDVAMVLVIVFIGWLMRHDRYNVKRPTQPEPNGAHDDADMGMTTPQKEIR